MAGAEGAAHEAAHLTEQNKKIALLIAVLALFLAFAETLAKASQTAALSHNVEAADLWAFFQAKTVRMAVIRTAAEAMEINLAGVTDSAVREAGQKRIDAWKDTVKRYESEPETREGRKELTERAKHAEELRDRATEKYHLYEVASAALQIAIVLASATVITGVLALSFIAGALGIGAIGLMALSLWLPEVASIF